MNNRSVETIAAIAEQLAAGDLTPMRERLLLEDLRYWLNRRVVELQEVLVPYQPGAVREHPENP